MSTLDLLPHNRRAYNKIAEHLQNGCTSVFYTAGTGTGKTYIVKALLDTYWLGCHVAYVVPTLAIQNYLYSVLQTDEAYIEMFTYDMFISTSVTHRLLCEFDVVVFDEAHHLGSKVEGAAAVEFMQGFAGICFGMTATPEREDGIDVTKFFEVTVQGISNYNAIQTGLMPQFEFYICNVKDAVEIRKQYNLRVDIPNSWQLMESVRNVRNFNRILSFYANVADMEAGAKDLQTLFPDYQIKTLSHLTSNVRETVELLQSDKVILCSCDMLLEGIHVPKVDTIFLFRNVQSTRVLQQILGRVCNIGRETSPVVLDFSTSAAKLYIKIMTEDYNAIKHRAGKSRKGRTLRPMLSIPATSIEAFDIMSIFAALQGGPVCVLGKEFSTLRAACRFYNISLEKILKAIPSVDTLDAAFRLYNRDRFVVGDTVYYSLGEVCREYRTPMVDVQSVVSELNLPVQLVVEGFGEFPVTVDSKTYNDPRDMAKQKGITIRQLIKYRYDTHSYADLAHDMAPKGTHIIFGKKYDTLQDFCKPLNIFVKDVKQLEDKLDIPTDKAIEEYCKCNRIVIEDRVYNTRNTLGAQLNITPLLTKYYSAKMSLSSRVLTCLDPKNQRASPVWYGKVFYNNLRDFCEDYHVSYMDILITFHNTQLTMSEAAQRVMSDGVVEKWCYGDLEFPSLRMCLWHYNIKYSTFDKYVLANDVTLHQAIDHFLQR